MLAYSVRRLLYAVIAFLLLTYAVWLLTTQQGIFALHHFSLDTFLPQRYQLWLVRVLHGDLGYSIRAQEDVLPAMRDALGVSLLLLVPAFILQELIAVALGLFAGSRYRSAVDRIISFLGFVGISTPNFWLALLLVEFFAVQWQILPASGLVDYRLIGTAYGTPEYWAYFHANTLAALVDLVRHLALPVAVLALTGIAADTQYVRLSLIEVLSQDYIRSARARGLKERTVLWKHAFRNTLVPLVTNIGLQLPRLVFAAMLIELIFSLPGIGHLFASAIYTPPAAAYGGNSRRAPKDYDVVTAYFLVLGVLSLLSVIVTDFIYAGADPRIRAGTSTVSYATNPLASRQPVLRLGVVHVQVRHIAIVLTTLAVLGAGLAIGHQFVQTKPPSIAGTWMGSATITGYTPSTIPLIMSIQVDSSGKITGRGYDCPRYDPSYPAMPGLYRLSGDTDFHTLVNYDWIPLNATYAYIQFQANYPTDNRTMNPKGLLIDGSNGNQYHAVMHLQRGGDVAQFQAACK